MTTSDPEKGYNEMKEEIEAKMESMNIDEYDEEDDDEHRKFPLIIEEPVFTPELGMLKKDKAAKKAAKPKASKQKDMVDEEDEDDIEEGSSESVSSFGDEKEDEELKESDQ